MAKPSSAPKAAIRPPEKVRDPPNGQLGAKKQDLAAKVSKRRLIRYIRASSDERTKKNDRLARMLLMDGPTLDCPARIPGCRNDSGMAGQFTRCR